MPQYKTRRVLGLDPGIARTGFGIVDVASTRSSVVVYGCINTESVSGYNNRLLRLENTLLRLIQKYSPDVAAIEKLFFCKNVKTAIAVGQARGVILLTLLKKHLVPFEFTPQQVKLAVTGYGKADKAQVQRMVRVLLGTRTIPESDDAADALALALAATTTLHHPKET